MAIEIDQFMHDVQESEIALDWGGFLDISPIVFVLSSCNAYKIRKQRKIYV